MHMPREFWPSAVVAAAMLGGSFLRLPQAGAGDVLENPAVEQMVRKATAYLERQETSVHPGGQALIALAFLKTGADRSHPRIQQGVIASQGLAAAVARSGIAQTCYDAAVCGIFLCELDPEQYSGDIRALLGALLDRQRPNGCWGYKPHTYDDCSQTQYGVLALWSAHAAGFRVPAESVERALQWFLRVQDVRGGWSYESKDPGTLQRIPQKAPTHSMTAAGLGSVYICSHLFGLTGAARRSQQQDSSLPPALRPVEEEERATLEASRVTRAAAATVKNALSAGNAWFAQYGLGLAEERWKYYYMYGLERCMAFRELAEGTADRDPAWYRAGVEFLRKSQSPEGGWQMADGTIEKVVDTAFCLLFLARSTHKSIAKPEEGSLAGGRQLPKDLTQVRLNNKGQVVDAKETPPVEELLALLERDDTPQNEFLDGVPEELELARDPAARAQQLARLRRLAASGSFQARLTAVRTLGRDRHLDNVPALIHALSDPDRRISKAAWEGLCLISRRFERYGISDPANREQVLAAQQRWNEWYRTVRPDSR